MTIRGVTILHILQTTTGGGLSNCGNMLQASLDDLNKRLEAPVSMNRFRPNIVLTGEQEPWSEDQWGMRNIRVQLRQGETVDLELCKPCSRCTVSICLTSQFCMHVSCVLPLPN